MVKTKSNSSGYTRPISTMRGLHEAGYHGMSRVNGYRMDPRALVIEPGFNVRFLEDPELREHIDSIKESLRTHITRDNPDERVSKGGLGSVIGAIFIRITEDGTPLVRDGHCRSTAIRELIEEGFDIQQVDVDAVQGDEASDYALVIRTTLGKKLEPVEAAININRMASEPHSKSYPEIARELGNKYSVQRIEQLVILARAPEQIRLWVAEKKISADSAIEVMRKHRDDPEAAVAYFQNLIDQSGGKTVGKAATRQSIPGAAQTGLLAAFTSNKLNKGLAKQLASAKEQLGDAYENHVVSVSLPATVLEMILKQHQKSSKKAKAAPAGDE